MNFNGYETMTTFWEDFSIADKFGGTAINSTYTKALAYAKTDYKYLTELVMVLNWKIWEHYENGNQRFAKMYDDLWRKTDDLAFKTLKNEELDYFIRTTD